jgi:acyl-CoA synthetase (AMP-forming)/AMP-acid ligase II
MFGSSGSLVPSIKVKLVDQEGNEITEYDKPGELVVHSPSVVIGYHNNDAANAETFHNGWMRTGDEAVVRLSPKGFEHIFIIDRIKELIKVKVRCLHFSSVYRSCAGVFSIPVHANMLQGLQVAPAELEAHILTHSAVADCCVIPVPDDRAGELPKAFVVKAAGVSVKGNEELLKREIAKHVEEHKARHKWLKGGIEFVDAIPKSPSGKILRRLLRDQEREARRKNGSRL